MQLLDFSQPQLDMSVLDTLVRFFYEGRPGSQEQRMAGEILGQFAEHENAWTRVHQILEESAHSETKFFALHILDGVISTQWKLLPPEQSEGIKNFLVEMILKYSADEETLMREKTLLGKMNQALVQVVKQEWPKRWPTFIDDIVSASKSSESLCQNNMEIFKILSEEVFEFSKGKMVQVKAQHLKDALCLQFGPIFDLCAFVFENSSSVTLVHTTLETLLRFLSWIPMDYVFSTPLIQFLTEKFFIVPDFRNTTLQCLAEIASLPGDLRKSMSDEALQELQMAQIQMFEATMIQMSTLLPPETDIRSEWEQSTPDQVNFIRSLSLFVSAWLNEHGEVIEGISEKHDALLQGLRYMVMCSTVEDKEIFKICLEYWNGLAASLYKASPLGGGSSYGTAAMFGGGGRGGGGTHPRLELYSGILSEVRLVMVASMARPEEVLLEEQSNGEVTRVFVKDTDSNELYKNMRVTLVYLTYLNPNDMERIMTMKLGAQMDGSEWSYKNLNTLCWAIGSIAGAMGKNEEKDFLVQVIKELLTLCEVKKGKDTKAIVASNIMYIVGQYPRFLRDHWRFLKTVVNKLFEFMHERHPGVQDMACDTFIKIAQKCKKHFVVQQAGERRPFVEEILEKMARHTVQLEPRQIDTFYEAVGYMIAAQDDPQTRLQLIERLMEMPNKKWSEIVQMASGDISVLTHPDAVQTLTNVLKTNVSACKSIGHTFIDQLGFLYMDMLLFYKTLNENVQVAITSQRDEQPLMYAIRYLQSEILKLISCWVSRSEDPAMVMENFIPPLLEAVLGNYEQAIPAARDAQVLETMVTIVNRLRENISGEVLKIFGAVFESTLGMINLEFTEFPEHRRAFYKLLLAIITHCFDAFCALEMEQAKMVIDAIVWGSKHPMRDVADTALRTLKVLLESVAQTPAMAPAFYEAFYVNIMHNMFGILTDSVHIGGLNLQASILSHMFCIVEQDALGVQLSGDLSVNNINFVQRFVLELLQGAFSHMHYEQIETIVAGFFSLNQDVVAFKAHLRDFLVQCKEAAGDSLEDLFLAERKEQLRLAAQEKMTQLAAIPGMLTGAQEEALEMA